MKNRWLRWQTFTVAGAAVVLLVSYFYVPGRMMPLSFCMLKNVFGIPCPLCGMTRSFCSLSHGHMTDAVVYHPAGPMLYAATFAVVGIGIYDLLARRDEASRLWKSGAKWLERPSLFFVALGVLWIIKLVAFAFFDCPA
jgi:hypothetical protein